MWDLESKTSLFVKVMNKQCLQRKINPKISNGSLRLSKFQSLVHHAWYWSKRGRFVRGEEPGEKDISKYIEIKEFWPISKCALLCPETWILVPFTLFPKDSWMVSIFQGSSQLFSSLLFPEPQWCFEAVGFIRLFFLYFHHTCPNLGVILRAGKLKYLAGLFESPQ